MESHDDSKKDPSAFSYDNLKKELITPFVAVKNDQYSAFINVTNKDFYYMQRIDPNETRRFGDKGLKIHFSFNTEPEDNIKKGWQIVRDVLMSHDVNYFKIIRQEHLKPSTSYMQDPGREVTFYAFRENDFSVNNDDEPNKAFMSRVNNLINEITEKLAEAKVQPGPLPLKDTAIKGTNYCSWRDDNERELLKINFHIKEDIKQPERPKAKQETTANTTKEMLHAMGTKPGKKPLRQRALAFSKVEDKDKVEQKPTPTNPNATPSPNTNQNRSWQSAEKQESKKEEERSPTIGRRK